MTPRLRKQRVEMHRRKGQSIVEFALGSILLVMLLATAIDLGRAFYTWQVVHQMAAEGAAYLARFPDNDSTSAGRDTYQGRAINVGVRAGRIFDRTKVDPTNGISAIITWTYNGAGVGTTGTAYRCQGNQFKVMVNYGMNDLFIPAFFGVKNLNLGAEETSAFLASSNSATTCP